MFRQPHDVMFYLVLVLLGISGCDDSARQLRGGTAGTIRLGGIAHADLQVNVFVDSPHPSRRLGYGVSDVEGNFSLITDEGLDPLTLPDGTYRCTLESVAADPIPIPRACRHIQTTPIVQEWPSASSLLTIEVYSVGAQK